jgi:hypothetical protein
MVPHALVRASQSARYQLIRPARASSLAAKVAYMAASRFGIEFRLA